MDELKEKAMSYHDGLISPKEFLGFVINIVGKEWDSLEYGDDSTLADDLAKKFAD